MKKFILLFLILAFSIGFFKLRNHYLKLDQDIVHSSVNKSVEEEIEEDRYIPPTSSPTPIEPQVQAPLPKKEPAVPVPKKNYNDYSEKVVAPDTPTDPAPSPQVSYDNNTLVSCSTLRKNCEPYNLGENENGEVETFCITYAGNCTNPSSIQRTWRHDEVFRPEPEPAPTAPHSGDYEVPQYEVPEIPPETPPYVPDPYNNGNGE